MADSRSREGESSPLDVDLDTAPGFGVYINIGHHSRQQTSNSATGSHPRNIAIDGGHSHHVGHDTHDNSTGMSGILHGANLIPNTANTYDERPRSMPSTSSQYLNQCYGGPPNLLEVPSPWHPRIPHVPMAGRSLPGSALSSPWVRAEVNLAKPRSSSFSGQRQSEGMDIEPTPHSEREPAAYVGSTLVQARWQPRSQYDDKPPHQDVAIRHLHGEPEASTQADWMDTQLLGRVVEVSAEDSHLHRRTMVVMAISAGVRYLQCVLVCRHPEVHRDSVEFHRTHVAVVEQRRGRRHSWQEVVGLSLHPVVILVDDPAKYALREHCYINYQHVWTVRNEVMFRNIGVVDDFERLKANFREAQRRLYDDG